MNSFSIFDARLKHPFTMVVNGPPLSGKTTFVTQLLDESNRLIDKEIDYIVWFYGEETHGLQSLKEKFGNKIELVRGLPDTFQLFIQKNKNGIFIFDDLMRECGSNKNITDLFSKQSHHQNISVILITQNMFIAGRERISTLRSSHYLVIFSNPLDHSVVYTLANKIMPKQQRTFLNIFEMATERPQGYLFIDGKQDTLREARFKTDIFGEYQRAFIPKQWVRQ